MNQTYCKLRNEFKIFNGNSAKSLNLAWTTLTLFFPIYFSVVNKKQSVQFFFFIISDITSVISGLNHLSSSLLCREQKWKVILNYDLRNIFFPTCAH